MKYGAIIAAVIAVLLIAAIAYFALQPPAAPMPTASPSPPTTPTPTQTPTATPQMRYTVIIATGGVGGVYYYYGGVIAGILKNFTNIDASSIQTAASIDNLLLIRDKTDPGRGVYYCGTVLPDSAYLAYTGQHDKFKD
ncbi:MAG: TAXI family TRAP transporter solute-binding subunit, partial [Pyrobaculum sp.]